MLRNISHHCNISLLWCSYITVSYINLFAFIKTIFFLLFSAICIFWGQHTDTYSEVHALSLLRHKFEKVEFLMSLMNVNNKYLNSGIFWVGVIQFLTTKKLIHQQDSKEQQKILNLKFLSFFFFDECSTTCQSVLFVFNYCILFPRSKWFSGANF